MEETREILVTRIFTFGELVGILTESEGGNKKLDSFEMSLPSRDGRPEWRRMTISSATQFIKVRFTEPLEKK